MYIHIVALRDAPLVQKRWIQAELSVIVLIQCLMFVWFDSAIWMLYSLMMVAANVAAPMVGIWAVHRQCESSPVDARSCRSGVINLLSCGMFYHAEHHLFPAVPTRHMRELATRIDATGVKFLGVTEFIGPRPRHTVGQ